MADTIRSKSELLALVQVGVPGGITAQTLRDVLVSVLGVYGSININAGAVPQAIAANTPEVLTAWKANGIAQGITPDYGNEKLIIDSGGVFQIVFNSSFDGISTAKQEFHLYINGTKSDGAGCIRYTSNNDTGSTGFSAQRALSATDEISIWVSSDKAGSITVKESQLTVSRIG